MIWWIYEVLFWFGLLLASPYYLLRMRRRGGYAADFKERFGFYSQNKTQILKNLRPLWIHAVSVGEINLALQLISQLQQTGYAHPILLSTTTSTGHALALQRAPDGVTVIYHPLDSSLCFKRLHRLTLPRAYCLIEAELWPNHLHFCKKQGLPMILINARLSLRRQPRYQKFRWLLAPLFQAFRLVTTQSKDDTTRLKSLGFTEDALLEIGSLKYDTVGITDMKKGQAFLSELQPWRDRLWIIAGSTHEGEESLLADIFIRLKKIHPTLILGIAPRHVERTHTIIQSLKSKPLRIGLRTELPSLDPQKIDLFILNTTGELTCFYELATVVFIGKSLTGVGGQNFIEAAACGKPVFFGPHMENFHSLVDDFLVNKAAVQVRDAQGLEKAIAQYLANPSLMQKTVASALQLLNKRKGGLDRTVQALLKILQKFP